MEMEEETSKRVHVRFVTKLNPPFKAPPLPIALPSNLTRLGLSTVLNNLLSDVDPNWKPEPFDFLINEELVRLSLERFLTAKGISAEKILEIEYIKAVIPRKKNEPSLHDDWVSAVDGSDSRFVLTGCYDGIGRVWSEGRLCTHLLEGHSGGITSVSLASEKEVDNITVATASKDRTLRIWKLDLNYAPPNPVRVKALRILRGHCADVQTVSFSPSGEMACSGSWDSAVHLWRTGDTGDDDDGVAVSLKKRKVGSTAKEFQKEGRPVSTLVGHTQCVSAVIWPRPSTIYSASWDHSVREWDVETGKDSFTIFCGKALNCVDVGGEGRALVAAVGSDPTLRIWDPRKPGSSAPIYQFSSHSSWVSACRWHTFSGFHLASASYDGRVMLWDLRTAWPLSVIDSHGDKVLCADWWRGDSVVSGGADSKLCISSQIPIQ